MLIKYATAALVATSEKATTASVASSSSEETTTTAGVTSTAKHAYTTPSSTANELGKSWVLGILLPLCLELGNDVVGDLLVFVGYVIFDSEFVETFFLIAWHTSNGCDWKVVFGLAEVVEVVVDIESSSYKILFIKNSQKERNFVIPNKQKIPDLSIQKYLLD